MLSFHLYRYLKSISLVRVGAERTKNVHGDGRFLPHFMWIQAALHSGCSWYDWVLWSSKWLGVKQYMIGVRRIFNNNEGFFFASFNENGLQGWHWTPLWLSHFHKQNLTVSLDAVSLQRCDVDYKEAFNSALVRLRMEGEILTFQPSNKELLRNPKCCRDCKIFCCWVSTRETLIGRVAYKWL